MSLQCGRTLSEKSWFPLWLQTRLDPGTQVMLPGICFSPFLGSAFLCDEIRKMLSKWWSVDQADLLPSGTKKSVSSGKFQHKSSD